MFGSRNAQRVATLVAMWLVLYVLGLNSEQHTWALWCIFALALVLEFLAFIATNKDRLRELSLRMVLKIADLRKAFPKSWTAMAQTTCMKRA